MELTKENVSKMDWFVKAYNNGSLPYQLKNTKENFGYIKMPTGYGKSSLVFEDIIQRYDYRDERRKQLINISCPIHKLDEQFCNDLFEILGSIYIKPRISFFINSSDDGKKYKAVSRIEKNVHRFSEISKFKDDKSSDMAIVISCHKSLTKFIDFVKQNNKDNIFDVVTYIDEGHKIDTKDGNSDDSVSEIDLRGLCDVSKSVYLFSATPDMKLVREINNHNSFGGDSNRFIIEVTPSQAIMENAILPPKFFISFTNVRELSLDMLEFSMAKSKEMLPNIHHKILVTMDETHNLVAMRKALEKKGYKVFSTCSRCNYGIIEGDNGGYNDISEWMQVIEDYQGDCFVMHLRQLINGIDIKSLTDCVSYDSDFIAPHKQKKHVQVIGRPQRMAQGERGLSKDVREKKWCNVFYFLPDNDISLRYDVEEFFIRVYGTATLQFDWFRYEGNGFEKIDNLERNNKNKVVRSSVSTPLEEIKINIEDYVREKIAPIQTLYTRMGRRYIIEDNIEDIMRMCDKFADRCDSLEFFDKQVYIDEVIKACEKYNVDVK